VALSLGPIGVLLLQEGVLRGPGSAARHRGGGLLGGRGAQDGGSPPPAGV